MIDFTRWPAPLAERYRSKGYWIDRPLSEILDIHADSDACALICGQRSWRYREFNADVNRLAAALYRRGARQGQTALVQLSNVAEFYLTYFALIRLGVVPVNALFSHQYHELSCYAEQIAPAWLIADRQHRLFYDDAFIDMLKSAHPTLQSVMLTPHAQETQLAFPALLQELAGDFTPTPTTPDEVAFFQLSGGSTGTPKLIPRTHNDYYYSVRASNPICGVSDLTRYLCSLPAAHNYPMSSPGWLGVFYAGGQVVLASDPNPDNCIPLIAHHQVNLAALVPSAVTLWLEYVERLGHARDLASLAVLLVGGSPLPEALARRIPTTLGCRLQQVFGMAEGLVCYTRDTDDDTHSFTTQGKPMSEDDEVWVADEDGRPLPYGEPGLLMTQGPYTFRGYYHNEQNNRTVFDSNGFYCSGDIVVQSSDGYLRVVGREKDQINRGGEKIAAEEIEKLLLRHPAIRDAALVAIPDPLMGEKSCACIVICEALNPVTLRRWLREQGIADYKLPDRIEIMTSLPLTPVGKINKQALRSQMAIPLS